MNFSLEKSIEILERAPSAYKELLNGVSDDWSMTNEGQKGDEKSWSPYDVLGHLIHGESGDWMERIEIILSDKPEKNFRPFDRLAQFEESKGLKRRQGTTEQGIGPCYVDKFGRTGIRVCDLMHPEMLRDKLDYILGLKNQIITRIYDEKPISFDALYDKAMEWKDRLSLYVGDCSKVVAQALNEGKSVLFEGAQGTMLDVDHGTYPYVTSSNPTCGGACTGTGVGPKNIDRIIGVAKAYCTRVGDGPLPTEDPGEKGHSN